ncbi:hypothetical protein [Alistipes onderdonkii]|uniref:hypothetical protein n=1 Tax=Alistipes onderdonkii TaxID=328813 RepID=UPI000689AEA0|nr:hypothetical protein [Alistipes onderdonkii]
MTVNGQTEEIKSAIYAEAPAGEFGENGVGLYLFKDVLTGMPEEEPDFGIMIVITESLYGKTIDLTKPVARSSYLLIAGMNKNLDVSIEYDDGTIDTTDGGSSQGPSVTGGTLLLTRSGDNFTVKLSVTLSDGSSVSADWKGTATKIDIPE